MYFEGERQRMKREHFTAIIFFEKKYFSRNNLEIIDTKKSILNFQMKSFYLYISYSLK